MANNGVAPTRYRAPDTPGVGIVELRNTLSMVISPGLGEEGGLTDPGVVRLLSPYHEQGALAMIHIIRSPASRQQIDEMLEMLESYVKLAVDVDRGILAGGGTLHADCEAALLEDGSKQEMVWGADWVPRTRQVHFQALINLRPRQDNMSMEILDPEIRATVEVIIRRLLETP
jgi:hypothetical protein